VRRHALRVAATFRERESRSSRPAARAPMGSRRSPPVRCWYSTLCPRARAGARRWSAAAESNCVISYSSL